MDSSEGSGPKNASELRERLPLQPVTPRKAVSIDTAKNVVAELNKTEEGESGDGKSKEKRTYGRTADGPGMCAQ